MQNVPAVSAPSTLSTRTPVAPGRGEGPGGNGGDGGDGGDGSVRGARLPLWCGRSTRVVVLCCLIAIVSIADLQLTLSYLRNGGMAEGNPIARYIMSFNCGWLLGAWKLLLTGLACGIFVSFRRRLSVELASWLCAGVMVWLVLQWGTYAELAPDVFEHIQTSAMAKPHDWVAMTEAQ